MRPGARRGDFDAGDPGDLGDALIVGGLIGVPSCLRFASRFPSLVEGVGAGASTTTASPVRELPDERHGRREALRDRLARS
jgi:hypothetical protein